MPTPLQYIHLLEVREILPLHSSSLIYDTLYVFLHLPFLFFIIYFFQLFNLLFKEEVVWSTSSFFTEARFHFFSFHQRDHLLSKDHHHHHRRSRSKIIIEDHHRKSSSKIIIKDHHHHRRSSSKIKIENHHQRSSSKIIKNHHSHQKSSIIIRSS